MAVTKIHTTEEVKTVEITQTFFSYSYQSKAGFAIKKEGFRTRKKMLADIEKNFKDMDVKIVE